MFQLNNLIFIQEFIRLKEDWSQSLRFENGKIKKEKERFLQQ